MVRLKNIEPLTLNGMEMAYRFAHGAPSLISNNGCRRFPASVRDYPCLW